MAKQIQRPSQKRSKRRSPRGVVHIQATFNNTIITVTSSRGDVITWSSSGACGFKGSRKATPFAAKTAATTAARQSVAQGMRQARVLVKGPGRGRETAIRGLQDGGLRIKVIRDITPLPHNGCRPPKKRRL